MNYLDYFAKNLKLYRQQRGWTQAQLAEHLNVHVSTVARIETAEHQASAQNIDKIVELLNISYGQFFNYYVIDEINPQKKELIEKINFLVQNMSVEELKYFLANMENYINIHKSKMKD